MTQYVILAREDDEVGYLPIGTEEATTDKGAIRKALQGVTEVKAEYVAVPTRSWRPHPVASQTRMELKIG